MKIKKLWIILLVVLIAAGGGVAFYLNSQQSVITAQAATSIPQTAQVKQGDLTLTASGTGSLVAGSEVNLSFPTSGTVAVVNVQPGDQVKQGDVLAELGDLDSLQARISSAQLDLATAKQDLADVTTGASSALGQAQLDVATAKKAYEDAKSALVTKGIARCDDDTLNAYYVAYMKLQKQLDDFGTISDTHSETYLNVVKPVKLARDQAYATYMYCNSYTDYEISSSQANVTITEAALKTAQSKLEVLQKNNGIDQDALATAQNKVASAELALSVAQNNLAGATIKAPFSGTIVSVAGKAGEQSGTATFINMADLTNIYVEFYVDETDLQNVSLGEEAQVVFDALPGKTFTGKVVQIQPKLTTFSGASTLKGLVKIESSGQVSGTTLPEGLNAAVEIIGGKAQNALLVPVDALRDLGDGEYGVFVSDSTGKLTFRTVQVGIMNLTYAEIKAGLNLGDVVTTGITETK